MLLPPQMDEEKFSVKQRICMIGGALPQIPMDPFRRDSWESRAAVVPRDRSLSP